MAARATSLPGFAWLRKLYDWVVGWADTPYGIPALFLIAFVESSFFPIPPDVLLIALSLGNRLKSFLFATVCTVGSVLGGMLGWWIGVALMDTVGRRIIDFYGKADLYEQLVNSFQEWGFMAVVIAALTPIPYKVFTIAAGAAHFSLLSLVLASIIGRAGRFFAVATMIYIFGDKVRKFIEKYFDLATIVFTVLLIGGFALLKFVH